MDFRVRLNHPTIPSHSGWYAVVSSLVIPKLEQISNPYEKPPLEGIGEDEVQFAVISSSVDILASTNYQ